nr:putative RNA-directed DNA polymerase, eukaryota [Tanacetum cinerariifolium]
MAACTGCEAGSFPFSYLGLPIGSNMSRIANWQILIDCFKARLSGWKANLLSIGGRLTLINSVLESLVCKTRTFALGDKPHSFFAPEEKPSWRGLNPRPLACGNNLPKVTLGGHLS